MENIAQKCRFLNVNLFVSGLNITLYNDHEKANCIKTELISFYFDDIGLFFDQKVHFKNHLGPKKLHFFLFFPRIVHLSSVF